MTPRLTQSPGPAKKIVPVAAANYEFKEDTTCEEYRKPGLRTDGFEFYTSTGVPGDLSQNVCHDFHNPRSGRQVYIAGQPNSKVRISLIVPGSR